MLQTRVLQKQRTLKTIADHRGHTTDKISRLSLTVMSNRLSHAQPFGRGHIPGYHQELVHSCTWPTPQSQMHMQRQVQRLSVVLHTADRSTSRRPLWPAVAWQTVNEQACGEKSGIVHVREPHKRTPEAQRTQRSQRVPPLQAPAIVEVVLSANIPRTQDDRAPARLRPLPPSVPALARRPWPHE